MEQIFGGLNHSSSNNKRVNLFACRFKAQTSLKKEEES